MLFALCAGSITSHTVAHAVCVARGIHHKPGVRAKLYSYIEIYIEIYIELYVEIYIELY